MCPIRNREAVAQAMAWHQKGNKPLHEPIDGQIQTHVHRHVKNCIKWGTRGPLTNMV